MLVIGNETEWLVVMVVSGPDSVCTTAEKRSCSKLNNAEGHHEKAHGHNHTCLKGTYSFRKRTHRHLPLKKPCRGFSGQPLKARLKKKVEVFEDHRLRVRSTSDQQQVVVT